ncbi:hypothetical protein NP493_252g00022 [Ridgeia piscesae]|uniref:WAP domain-containing protein n=1 Tax=Ridgeia piscesae TaxID=27915 RepID=A0AAD9NYG4_RIDPI|nr:hypothetical protein NP493_252g00022 [Ridgeia piscesae]
MDGMQADSPIPASVNDGPPERPRCPPTPDYFPAAWCRRPTCQSDDDCADIEERCCFNGCVDSCTTGVPPSPVVDWLRQPPTKLLGRSWLVGEEDPIEDDPDNDLDEPCSTTRLAGDSLLCPHGYVCRVTYRGDRRKGIPNRGKCVPQKQRRRKGRLFHPRTPGGAAADYVSTWSFLPRHRSNPFKNFSFDVSQLKSPSRVWSTSGHVMYLESFQPHAVRVTRSV